MKKIRINLPGILFFILLFATFFTACNKDSDIGIELLPKGDFIEVKNVVIKDDFSAYTYREDSIRTDMPAYSLLGSFSDSLFGITTIDMATQFRIISFPDFGTNPQVDSIKLYLYYKTFYGDTLTNQRFKVYELIDDIYADIEEDGISYRYPYYQNVDLKSKASSEVLGEIEYRTKVTLDSTKKDTLYQLIAIPLNNSLGEKLLSIDSAQMTNTDDFINHFKGLLVESTPVAQQGGNIISLQTVSNDYFRGSALVLYFHNDDLKSTSGGDSTQLMPYLITTESARVNHIGHDYSGSPFYAQLNSQAVEDSLIYVQPTGGLKALINIEGLSSWADSTDIAINKAELVFQVDTIASQVHRFPPPRSLLFTYINENGSISMPYDYSFYPGYYGGFLNTNDYTYRFNITQHLQQIIDGTVQNRGFYLTTGERNYEANRVVLKGSTSATGIGLYITYSKINQ